MTRIKMHIFKVKLPFYLPCKVKCGLQNRVSTGPYNSPLKFPFLAPREERRILMSLNQLHAYFALPLLMKTPFFLSKTCFQRYSIRGMSLLNFGDSLSPTFYGMMRIVRLRASLGIERELSRFLLSPWNKYLLNQLFSSLQHSFRSSAYTLNLHTYSTFLSPYKY